MSDVASKRKRDEPPADEESGSVEVFDVEAIRAMRKTRGGHVEYLIKWAGYSSDQNSWEREENLQCPEKLEEFLEAQKQKTAKKARAKAASGEENSASGATSARSPVKSEGSAVKDESRSPVPVPAESKSLEKGDEVERILGARRNDRTSELELYVKWKGEPLMSFAPAKEMNRRYPEMVISFYESRLRFPGDKK